MTPLEAARAALPRLKWTGDEHRATARFRQALAIEVIPGRVFVTQREHGTTRRIDIADQEWHTPGKIRQVVRNARETFAAHAAALDAALALPQNESPAPGHKPARGE